MGIRIALIASLAVSITLAVAPGCSKKETPEKKAPGTLEANSAGKATAGEAKPGQGSMKIAATVKDGKVKLLKSGSAIEWIEDDFDAAMAASKKTGKPVVVDMWAPWCHTCLSMKATVLKDAGLAQHANRFVWVALDTDKKQNAGALEKLPVSAWPTFFVLSPKGDIAARFLGSASVKQFRDFLDEGERSARAEATLEKGTASWHLRAGDRAASKGTMDAAAKAYAAALKAAPADWPRRADVLVSQISALYKAGDHQACATLGMEKLAETLVAKSASTADFSYYATSCADKMSKTKGGKGFAKTGPLRVKSIEAILKVLGDPTATMSADDRSDGLRIVRSLFEAAGQEKKALEFANQQRKVLDDAAAAADNAFFAMTYNWPRSEVYVYLGKGEELLPALKQSALDLPKEYDPPYRLAWVLHKLGKNDEALAEVAKAEALAYGPRKGRVLGLKAAILEAKGDAAATRLARTAVLAHYESLPAGQRSEKAIANAKAALAIKKPAKK